MKSNRQLNMSLNLRFIAILFFSFPSYLKALDCDLKSIDFDYLHQQIAHIKLNDTEVKDHANVQQQLFSTEGKQYLQLYRKCIAPVLAKYDLTIYDKKQLHSLYTAIHSAAFYSGDLAATQDFAKITFRKMKLVENSDDLITRLYHTYIQTRQFTKATELAKQYPNISFESVIKVIDATGKTPKPYQSVNDNIRSYFAMNEKGNQITRHKFEFPKGPHIVVVSSSICNPCKRLFTWLKTKPNLMKVMDQHTTWLTPAVGQLFVDEMLSTYQTYQPIKLNYAHRESEWPEISYWATPTFYFYQDGVLVGQLVGWPHKGREQQLLAILTKLGLLA